MFQELSTYIDNMARIKHENQSLSMHLEVDIEYSDHQAYHSHDELEPGWIYLVQGFQSSFLLL